MIDVALAYFALAFLALFCSGVRLLDSPVKIVPYDVVFLLGGLLFVPKVLLGKRLGVTRELRVGIGLGMVLLAWVLLQALRSPDIGRAVTLVGILTRDIGTMVLVGMVMSNWRVKRQQLANLLFSVGSIATGIALLVYVRAISDPAKVSANPKPGLIYRAGEGFFPHLQGFANNPIYFAVLILIAIAAGLVSRPTTIVGRVGRWAGLGVLFLGMIMTFSRGALITMVVAACIVAVIVGAVSRSGWTLIKRLVGGIAVGGLILVPVLSMIEVPGQDVSVLARIVFRFTKAQWSSRADNYWWSLLPDVYDRPVVGHGLRAAELKLFGQAAENSYLDIVYDQGLVGLMLWSALICYIYSVAVRQAMYDGSGVVFAYIWSIVVLSMAYVSMHYDPITWLIAGLVLSGVERSGGRERKAAFCCGVLRNTTAVSQQE